MDGLTGLVFTLSSVLCFVSSSNITVGLLVPVSGPRSYGYQLDTVAKIVTQTINNDQNLTGLRSKDIQLQYIHADTKCDIGTGLVEIINIVGSNIRISGTLGAFIGPACDHVCDAAGYVAGSLGIPIISYACAYDHLSDLNYHKTFARTSSSYDNMSNVLIDLMKLYGWDRALLVEGHEDVWAKTAENIAETLKGAGYSHDIWKLEYNEVLYEDHFKVSIKLHRIMIICAYGYDIIHLMCTAKKLGFINGEFAFISIDFSRAYTNDVQECELTEALEGLLDLTLDAWHTTVAEISPVLDGYNLTATVHAGLLYDAFRLYSEALNGVVLEGGDVNDTNAIVSRLRNITFKGVDGDVHIDDHGTREGEIVIHNIHEGRYITVAKSKGVVGSTTFVPNITVYWPGRTTIPPLGRPRCGWNQEFCNDDNTVLVAAIASSVVFLVAVTAVTIGLCERRRKKAIYMYSMSWKLNSEDLVTDSKLSRHIGLSKSSRPSTDECSPAHSVVSDASNMQMFTKVSRHNGLTVAVKAINKTYIAITNDVIKEMNQFRKLKHTNVNSLLGAIVEPTKICLINEYCSKGSLQDVLENDSIKLDWIFKMSFITDIAKGMVYIHHSEIESHGRLKSSNVLIDGHWICKVGDMAMPYFREGERQREGKNAVFYGLLWTAPELLREDNTRGKGTQKGDVFSFAIIIQEIITRTGPYSYVTDEPFEIIERVKNVEHPPYRPEVPFDAASDELLNLMRICWEEIAMFRPSFSTIVATLKRCNKGKHINLVDQMVRMMEKYADNLEDIVAERTQQLEEEQKKTEDLLCRMLPRSISNDLKLGKTVEPENFEEVTVLFSDVVEFTALSSESTPLQVVNFLNDLYTCFDTIIEYYDVYKIETIGDAYMVVSGLPRRNGKTHAGEVATLSLDLLSSVVTFKIRHKPEMQLQLRIGIHSGPVAAGVVGLKMPRYCLFGDTVNFASRMESSGLALRIHVSPFTKAILDNLGGYHLLHRGAIPLKGKGIVETYFLLGKDGFMKNLPDISLAAPLQSHEFK